MPGRTSHTTVEWNGDEIEKRFRRATGRGTIGVGERVGVEAKKIVHVWNGDLRRSIHVAQAGQVNGEGGPLNWMTVQLPDGALVEVGSWLDYACVEETGRNHKYMQPGLELAARRVLQIFRRAFKEEGF